jgi:hypothetical protein
MKTAKVAKNQLTDGGYDAKVKATKLQFAEQK